MTKAVEIFSVFAVSLGMRLEDVTEIARRVREGGYFVKENRSANSPRATARHCANLLAAILSDEPARHAARGVENAQLAITDHGETKHAANFQLKEPLDIFTKENHSFIDGIEAIFKSAILDPVYFEERFRGTTISYQTIKCIGDVAVCENDLENPGDYLIDFRIGYANNAVSGLHRGEMIKEMIVGIETIAAVGRLIARGGNV